MLMDADGGEGVSKIIQKVLTYFMDGPYGANRKLIGLVYF